MRSRPWANERPAFRVLFAAVLIGGSPAIVLGQTPPQAVDRPAAAPSAAPRMAARQPAPIAQFAPGPPTAGSPFIRPPFVRPPFNGPPPFAYPPPPAYPYPPILPGPYPPVPIEAPPPPPLPEMVYVVAPKFWFRPDALVWWTKSAPMPQPIVTTGSATDTIPGALGQSGTQVAFGGGNLSYGYIGGLRLETGVWLDAARVFGLEAGYFVLIQQNREFTEQSDPYGNPLIARPTIDARSGAESAYVGSLPNLASGGVDVITRSEFQGANFDCDLNLIQTAHVRLDGLLGFRYLSLVESLNIYDQYNNLASGARGFAGAPLASGDMLADFDGFRTTNSFYGGTGGARLYYASGRWVFTALGKAALGTVQERAVVAGSTTFTDQSGQKSMLPGGVLATTANIGSHYQSPFAVVPEGQFNLGYQITPLIIARIGYSFIYVSNVVRPGDQVNRATNPNLVPSDLAYGHSGVSAPVFQLHSTSYWAQGLNFGLDFHF